jgi:hypothetical protein
MITVSEIKKKSETIYREYLQSIVRGEIFFPKALRSDKSVSSDFNEMRKELAEVIEHSKDRKGFGYTIVYRQIKTRKHGIQSLPEEISFQIEADFLKYLHKEEEVAQFGNDCSLILSDFSELKEWIIKYPLKVIENHSQWGDLLKVCNYFRANPKPNLYIRELPVRVHTKYIENNKGILKELLDILIAEHINPNETNFEKRFNLKYAEPLVRFRVLDEHIAQAYFSEISDLSITVSQFEKLDLPEIKRVFIVENKTNLLTIALSMPEIEKTIVIFGSGYKVENLKKAVWLNNVELLYWGDLDADGFQILSQFRGFFPHVKSILMDQETFDKFSQDKVEGAASKSTATYLQNSEKKLYDLLKSKNWRLEQEKIPLEYVKDILDISNARTAKHRI